MHRIIDGNHDIKDLIKYGSFLSPWLGYRTPLLENRISHVAVLWLFHSSKLLFRHFPLPECFSPTASLPKWAHLCSLSQLESTFPLNPLGCFFFVCVFFWGEGACYNSSNSYHIAPFSLNTCVHIWSVHRTARVLQILEKAAKIVTFSESL